ncbi:MAG: hypothetical protein K6L75_01330 [Cellvibrionaceae bacterium]
MSNFPTLNSQETSLQSPLDIETKTYIANLNQLACLIVSGQDARSFLQGQVTCDMNAITLHHSLPGAHCTNKGRAVFTFRAIQLPPSLNDQKSDSDELNIALVIPKELIDIAFKALSKFIVFSKATLQITEDYKMLGVFGKNSANVFESIQNAKTDTQEISLIRIQDNQIILLGKESAVDKILTSQEVARNTDFSDWQLANIRNGIADIYSGTSELFLPQMLNFDNNKGISYNKGCYIGQEIVARMHHKGKLKRHLRRVSLSNCHNPPLPGNDVYSAQSSQSIGHIVISESIGPDSFEALIIVTDDAFGSQKIYLDQEKTLNLHPLSLPYAINNEDPSNLA